jgi:hypothetical protein
MISLFSGTIEVQYGQAYLEAGARFDGGMEACFLGQSNGICGAAVPGTLFLTTGLHTGPVGLAVNLFEADPGPDEDWEEIVEVSLAVSGPASLVEWASDAGAPLALAPGSYRARYSARGMEAGRELDTNVDPDPVDHYRLDLWPAPPAPDRIVKQTSETAAYWHDWAQGLGKPAQ